MIPNGTKQKIKILLVADNTDDALYAISILGSAGTIDLDHVDDSTRAVESLGRVAYDAILLGLQSPDADGLDGLETLRASAPHVPIVSFSGPDDEGLTVRAMRRGARSHVVRRYVDGEIFLRTVHGAIERHRATATTLSRRTPSAGRPERELFQRDLRRALSRTRRNDRTLALTHLALGRSHEGSCSYRTDDRLRTTLSRRLTSSLRSSDIVAATGNGEFMILTELARPDHAIAIAGKILAAARASLPIEGRNPSPTVHLGVALWPNDGHTPGELLRSAAGALARAVADERDQCFSQPELDARLMDRSVLGPALRAALQREEFEVRYQPLLDLASGRIRAMEALVRWRHPGGRMPPKLFLPVAEECGLGSRVGEWVLRNACAEARNWWDGQDVGGSLSVNLSRSQLLAEELADSVKQALLDSGLEPRRLELEVKEADLPRNRERAVDALSRLNELGVLLCLDDFAWRSVSVPQLEQMPIDGVKLDGSLLPSDADDPKAAEVVRGTVSLAHGCDLRVTAKGVETAEHLDLARESGCDRLQGYLVGAPQPASAVRTLLDRPSADQASRGAFSDG